MSQLGVEAAPLGMFPGVEQRPRTRQELMSAKLQAKKVKERNRERQRDTADDDESASEATPKKVLTPEETLAIQKQRKFQLWVGVIGFLSIVPVFFAMPYVVEGVLYVMRERVHYLKPIWIAEAASVVALYFYKTKHTTESFFTQFLTWALFTLGINTVGSMFQFVREPEDKMLVLKLFATVTFLFYAAYVFFDDFDYINKEKTEKLAVKKAEKLDKLREEKINALKMERLRATKELKLS